MSRPDPKKKPTARTSTGPKSRSKAKGKAKPAPQEAMAPAPPSDGTIVVAAPATAAFPLFLDDAPAEAFAGFVAEMLGRVGPGDHVGRMLAELVVQAAGRIRKAADLEPEDKLPGADWCRYQALAERTLRAAARDLQRHLDRLPGGASAPAQAPAAAEPEAGARAPSPSPARPESTPEEVADAGLNWRRHIALVRSVSEEWPILLRSRREADSVAAWLADGRTDEELLTWFPDLTRADIAACRACDAEGLCGPFDPADGPYPPGLPVFDDFPGPPPR